MPLQYSRELKLFPLRELCKDWNKRKSEGAVSAEYSDESGLPSQAGTVFARSGHQGNMQSRVLVMEDSAFSVGELWTLFIESSFQLVSLEQHWLELVVWFSRRSS